jgi:hypothetical protein
MAETYTSLPLVFTEDILERSYSEVSTGLDKARVEEIEHLRDSDMALAGLFGDLLADSAATNGLDEAIRSVAGFVVAARAVRYASVETSLPPHSDSDVKRYYGYVSKKPAVLGVDFIETYADQSAVLDLANNRLSNDLSKFAARLVFTLNGLVGGEQPIYRIAQLVPQIPAQRTPQQRVLATRELKKSRARFGLTS